jgi:5'-3' exonuclease
MTYIVVDGKNAMFRFGWTGRNLSSADGTPTGAVYGLLRLMLRLKKKYPVSQFIFAWDGPGQSWRYRLFPGYKSNRHKEAEIPKPVKDVLAQVPLAMSILSRMNVLQIVCSGVEADDIVGILAGTLSKEGEVVVYSSDKDFLQLMGLVQVIRDVDKSDKLAPETERKVIAKFGCGSKDVLKVRAIAGDKGDGIPNPIAGLGPKTAAKLIASGVDPSSEKCCRSAPKNVRAFWKEIHRNYKLMRLPLSASNAEFTPEQREYLEAVCSASGIAQAFWPSSNANERYVLLVQRLAQLQLLEALESRLELFRIQSR